MNFPFLQSNLQNHPFLLALINQSISPSDFITLLSPFKQCIEYWPHVLMTLLHQLDHPDHVKRIAENIFDESGGGSFDQNHVVTFSRFISSFDILGSLVFSFGIKSNIFKKAQEAATMFLTGLKTLETLPPKELAFALAGIEYVYISISKVFHDFACLTLHKEDVDHYSNHELLDHKHSNDLWQIGKDLAQSHGEDDDDKNDIKKEEEKMIARGCQLFDCYFSILYSEMCNTGV